MKEIEGDMWDFYEDQKYVVCVTTNGFVKANGDAVCDRGNALEATKRIPGFARLLGDYIKSNGNVAGIMRTTPDEFEVFVFPVKYAWWERASKDLISASAHILSDRAVSNPDIIWILPRPGCYNGRLEWKDVKPILEFLPDNVHVITRKVVL